MYTVKLYYRHNPKPEEFKTFSTFKEAENFCKINKALSTNIVIYQIIGNISQAYDNDFKEVDDTLFVILKNHWKIALIIEGLT